MRVRTLKLRFVGMKTLEENPVKQVLFLVTLFVLSLGIATPGQAQTAAEANKSQYVGIISPDSTTTCTYPFTAGTGNAFIKYCVTKNGNIIQFASPAGIEYISKAPAGEGYGFCDFDSETAYYDYAGYGDSGNWQPPVKVSSSKTAVTISRKTTDGKFTLLQTISLVPANILAQVQMSIVNNTTGSAHIGLLRYADVDVRNESSNSFDYTSRTAFGYLNGNYGLTLRFASGYALNGGFSQDIPGGPDPCNIFLHVLAPLSATDGSIFMQFDMELAKKATGNVIVQYRSF
jgi:hypothetical protein